MNHQKITSIIDLLSAVFPDLVAIYLYGSAVKGALSDDSDLDIGLLFSNGKEADGKTLFLLKPQLNELAGMDVDLGVLSLENPVFAKEVLAYGERIFCRNLVVAEEFEMYAFSLYAKLNYERKEVISAYLGLSGIFT